MVQTGRSTETEVRLNCTVLCDIELCNWFNIVLQENFFHPYFCALRMTGKVSQLLCGVNCKYHKHKSKAVTVLKQARIKEWG